MCLRADATDNCGPLTLTNSLNSQAASSLGPAVSQSFTHVFTGTGTYPVTWTATDGSGNVNSCTVMVTVIDTQAPTVQCSACFGACDPNADPPCASDLTVECGQFICLRASAADSCGPITLSNSLNSQVNTSAGTSVAQSFNHIFAAPGTYVVTWTATDGSGNTTTCSVTVTVIDNQAPSVQCSACLGACDPNADPLCASDLVVECGQFICLRADAADNCGPVTLSNNLNSQIDTSTGTAVSQSFNHIFSGPGTYVVTWTATDGSGNVTTCSVTVTVIDNQAPTVQCNACYGICDPNADPICSPELIVECGQPVCLRADANDNCGPVTLSNDLNSQVDFSAGSSVSQSFTHFFTAAGSYVVTFTATDGGGNSTTCSVFITVIDTVSPTLTCCAAPGPCGPGTQAGCTSPLTVLCGESVCLQATAIDGCGPVTISNDYNSQVDSSAGTSVSQQFSATFNSAGTYTVTFTATDGSGNTVTCTVEIVVQCCAEISAANMVSWWPLDELAGSTVIVDVQGGNNGSSQPGPVSGTGPLSTAAVVGTGMYFYNQPVQHVKVPDNASLNFAAGDFSIDAWIDPVPVGVNFEQPIVDKYDAAGPSGYKFYGNGVGLSFTMGNGSSSLTANSAPITQGVWQFVAVTIDRGANVGTFWVNGVSAGTFTPLSGSYSNTIDLLIGGINNGAGVAFGEIGLDEVEIFNNVLPPADILAIYNAGSAGKCPLPLPVQCDCCGAKPQFPDYIETTPSGNNGLYSTFTGEVAAATCSSLPAPFGPGPLAPVLVIIDLKNQATAPINTNWSSTSSPPTAFYHHPTWTQGSLGDVFGLTLDNGGNIYVTASTSYGLGNVGFAGAGGIYRINNGTALPSAFVTTINAPVYSSGNQMPNTGPGLGNINYDCGHDKFYVSNFEDGMIYRIDAAGTILSLWDHGANRPFGTPVLAALPDDGLPGFTALGRRVWGVQVCGDRLYYGVWWEDIGRQNPAEANEIWSVALDGAGDFIAATNRREIVVPDFATPYSNPVSDISFGPAGTMMLAERTMSQDASPGAHFSRALEYVLVGTTWVPSSNLFDIGDLSGIKTNAAGGTDYDFGPNSRAWFTGDALHLLTNDELYGLQGTPQTGGDITTSILIDLDEDILTHDKTLIGDVEIACPSTTGCDPDTTAPTLGCSVGPGPCPAAAGSTGSSITVNCGDPVCLQADASDNCGPLTISNDLTGALTTATGTSVSQQFTHVFNTGGVYVVTWTVTDGNGNTATCSVTVTVDCCAAIDTTNMVSWWQLDELAGATVIADVLSANNGSSQPGPVSGTGPLSVAAVVNTGMYFYNQPVQHVEVPNSASLNFGAGDFSIDAWINPVPVGVNFEQPIVDKYDAAGPSGYKFYGNGVGLSFTMGNGSTSFTASSAPITQGVWQLVAVTVDRGANVGTFWVNGVSAGTFTPLSGSYSNTIDLLIGGINGTLGAFGEIALDEIEIFNNVLDPADIMAIYTAGGSGKCTTSLPPPCACCGTKPQFPDLSADPVGSGGGTYSTFTGQVAAATCYSSPVPPGQGPLGPVLVIIDLKNQATAPINSNWDSFGSPPTAFYHHPSWSQANLGDVFGLTFDNGGNIYVTATTTYGFNNVGAAGPGGIYRINNVTALPSTFVSTVNAPIYSSGNQLPNTGPGLGNINFDCGHGMFYVSNFEDGMIYRIDPAGNILSLWDHGANRPFGTPVLAAIPDDGLAGFTAHGRRVWAVQVCDDRLYYGIWWEDFGVVNAVEANEVWSVALDATGDFIPTTQQREIILPVFPAQSFSSPVSDISFGPTGAMMLAERGMFGDTSPLAHVSRGLEYVLVGSTWTPSTNLFDIGDLFGATTNTAGGTDYDHGVNGRAWFTGDALHYLNNDYIYGLQGVPLTGGGIASSILIDINEDILTINKTEIGDVEIPCPPTSCDPDTTDPTLSCTVVPGPCGPDPVAAAGTAISVICGEPLCLQAVAADNCGPLTLSNDLTGAVTTSSGTSVIQKFSYAFASAGVYVVTWTVTDGAGNTATCSVTITVDCCAEIATANMVGWWPLDETAGATIVTDLTGANNGTPQPGPVQTGGPLAVPAVVNGGFGFVTPLVQYVRVPSSGSLNFGGNDFSIDGWIKPVFVGAGFNQPIVDKYDVNVPEGYAFYVDNDTLKFTMGNGSTSLTATSNAGAVTPGVWQFVAVTIDRSGNVGTFYVNGAAAGSFTPLAGSYNSAIDLLIGGINGPPVLFGEIHLDEIEIFDIVVPAPDLQAIYAAGPLGKCKELPQCECCGVKPQYPDYIETVPSGNNGLYSTFSGQVAAATCSALNAPEPVLVFFDLQNQLTAPLNTNWDSVSSPPTAFYHHPTWDRNTLGQVFGLTFDDAGNLYVGASTSYGTFFAGAAGAGGIYRINNVTALPSPFVSTVNAPVYSSGNLIANTGTGLGNIDFHCGYQQFYVSNFEDGMIYRIDTAGTILSVWDHGASLPSGVPAQAAIPDDGLAGFTALGRRVWGLASCDNHLYYAIWREDTNRTDPLAANEVWSVQLDSGGDFMAGTNRREIVMPPFLATNTSNPVADISFGPGGVMMLTERAMSSDTNPGAHDARALQYVFNGISWVQSANAFGIGDLSGLDTNSAGGNDYDFGPGGRVWVSGDALHLLANDAIYGFQGLPLTGGSVVNSILIDANEDIITGNKTQIGDVELPCPSGQ